MTTSTKGAISRRSFLADAGVLVVGFTLMPRLARAASLGAASSSRIAPPSGDQLDSWHVPILIGISHGEMKIPYQS